MTGRAQHSGRVTSPPCAYCGRNNKPSREHVLPQWLSRYTAYADGPLLRVQKRTRNDVQDLKIPELVTKRVCEPCNNGWMASIEGETAPLLTELFQRRGQLEYVHQFLLARWMTKLALTAHLAISRRADPLWLTPGTYRAFYRDQSPFRRTAVFLAGIEGTRLPTNLEVRRTFVQPKVPVFRSIFRCETILLQFLVLPVGHTMQLSIDETQARRVHMIWPPVDETGINPKARDWPPPETYTANTVDDFALMPVVVTPESTDSV